MDIRFFNLKNGLEIADFEAKFAQKAHFILKK